MGKFEDSDGYRIIQNYFDDVFKNRETNRKINVASLSAVSLYLFA